jgi:hypothetical protein
MNTPNKLPFLWPPSVDMIGNGAGDARQRGLLFCWTQHAPASHSKACKQCGCLIKWVDPDDPQGMRSSPCALCTLWKHGYFEKVEDLDKLNDIVIPERLERMRENLTDNKLADGYRSRFGGSLSIVNGREVLELMALSLTSGIDQLVEQKQRQKEHWEGGLSR